VGCNAAGGDTITVRGFDLGAVSYAPYVPSSQTAVPLLQSGVPSPPFSVSDFVVIGDDAEAGESAQKECKSVQVRVPGRLNHARFCQSLLSFAINHSLLIIRFFLTLPSVNYYSPLLSTTHSLLSVSFSPYLPSIITRLCYQPLTPLFNFLHFSFLSSPYQGAQFCACCPPARALT
jgi:hypothetical protein